jgi:hypothetical protein
MVNLNALYQVITNFFQGRLVFSRLEDLNVEIPIHIYIQSILLNLYSFGMASFNGLIWHETELQGDQLAEPNEVLFPYSCSMTSTFGSRLTHFTNFIERIGYSPTNCGTQL